MAALVCDICGGKLVIESGGIAVCDNCGMEHSPERIKEKVNEAKGDIFNDNSHMIDDWMRMGRSAAEAGNHEEAYEYYKKVVEVDPSNWRAIYEKGKAGAWQSTLGNLRTSELYQGVNKAFEIISQLNLSEVDRVKIHKEFAIELYDFNNRITDLMQNNLDAIGDLFFDFHFDQIYDTRQRHLTNVSQIENALTLISEFDDWSSKFYSTLFKKRILLDLRWVLQPTMYWSDFSKTTLRNLGYTADEKKDLLDKYWKWFSEISEVEPSFATDKWNYPDPFDPGGHSIDEIYDYWKEVERKKRLDAYWAEHAEEEKQYLDRINAIESEIKSLNSRIRQNKAKILETKKELEKEIPLENQLDEIKKQQVLLFKQKASLGIFAGKQRKQLQEQIDSLQSQIPEIEESIRRQKKMVEDDILERVATIESDCNTMNNQIKQLEEEQLKIANELTKER